jgi:hypothetical protein
MHNDPLRTAEANNALLTGQANAEYVRVAQVDAVGRLGVAIKRIAAKDAENAELRSERDRLQFQYNAALEELEELRGNLGCHIGRVAVRETEGPK